MAKINKIKVENTEYDVEDTSALKEVPSEYKTKAENDELYQAKGDYATNQRANEIEAEIPDVSQFITKTVNDLTNYYLKSETYTKDEVTALIGAIQQFHYEVVQELPQTGANNILYLVPKAESQTQNVYDEYVYANNTWEKIGDTEIDLSNYVTTTDLNTALSSYTTTTDLTTLLAGKQNTIDSIHKLSSDLVDDTNATNKFVTSAEKSAWNGKQDTLTAGDNITIENNVISASGGTYNWTYNDISSEEALAFWQKMIDIWLSGKNPIITTINPNAVDNIGWLCTNIEGSNYSGGRFARFHFTDIGKTVNSGYTGPSMGINGFFIAVVFDENGIVTNITKTNVANYSLARIYDGNNSYGVLGAKNTTAYTPTAGSYNPATAKYAEDQAEAVKVQYSTMPTASVDNLGKIVQYTGATDSTYTQGHFYIVVSDGADPATYSWEEISFEGGSDEKVVYVYEHSNFVDEYTDTNTTTLNLFNSILNDLNNGKAPLLVEHYNENYSMGFCYKTTNNIFCTTMPVYNSRIYGAGVKYRAMFINATITNNNVTRVNLYDYSANLVYQYGASNSSYISNNNFALVTSNTQSYTPTADYNPATKKYVDDSVKNDKLTGTTAPTTATVGYVGQQYTDTTNNNQYVCTAIDDTDPQAIEYTWVQVNGGGSSKEYVIYSNDTTETKISVLNEAYQKYLEDYNNPTIYWVNTSGSFYAKTRYVANSFYVSGNNLNIVFYSINAFNGMFNRYKMPRIDLFELKCTLSNNAITAIDENNENIYGDVLTKYGTGYSLQDAYYSALGVNNTASYTPTGNYNPATKLSSETVPLTLSGLSAYNSGTTYQVGDYVYRSATDLTIYKCTTADTTGTWDSAKWDSKTYIEYLKDALQN